MQTFFHLSLDAGAWVLQGGTMQTPILTRAFLIISLASVLACASGNSARREFVEPFRPVDFLAASQQVGGLERSALKSVASADGIAGLSAEEAPRWQSCGVLEASQALYSRSDPKVVLKLRILAFDKAWDAFCAYTPGRSDTAYPVLDLDGAFADKNFARAWRGPYLVEVSGEFNDDSRDRALGLLRATIARMPTNLPNHVSEYGWLPESAVVAGSEHITFDEVIPGLKAAAFVAKIQCDETLASVFIIPFVSSKASKTALDAYQQRELENFSEVLPYKRNGLDGAKIVAEKGTSLVLRSETHLLGLRDVSDPASCEELIGEMAIRAAPTQAQ